MTATVEEPGGHRTPARRKARTDWIGHHWIVFFLTAITSGPFVDLLPHMWAKTLGVALTIGIAPALFLGIQHDASLCERCAARMPLDGAEQAAKYSRRLHLVHLPSLWSTFVFALVPTSFLLHGWAAFSGELAVMPFAVYAWVATRTHRHLYPWCPRCRWGNGGDGIEEPSPDPSIDAPSPQLA